MFSKKALQELTGLDPKIESQIPNPYDCAEVREADAKVATARAQLQQAKETCTDGSYSASGPCQSAGELRELILAGKNLAECEIQSHASLGEQKGRYIQACEKLILELAEKARLARASAVRAACKKIEHLVEPFELDCQAALDAWEKAFERKAVMFRALDKHGISSDSRPPHWGMMPWESKLMFGANGFTSLRFFLDQRKKVWGFLTGKK